LSMTLIQMILKIKIITQMLEYLLFSKNYKNYMKDILIIFR
jgi:hypothetical protein